MRSRVIIVDDHPIFRMGMGELLNQEDDFFVCGLAEDITSARKVIEEEAPDLAIVDITLAGDNGLDLVKELSKQRNPLLILVLSMHDEQVWAERAIRAGARGYIMKKEASENVISALRNIRNGKIHVSHSIMERFLDRLQTQPEIPIAPTVDRLTDRELEVFRLIGSGLSTREIAERMKLGLKTIGTYRDRVKHKLGIKNAAELSRRAVLWTEKDFFKTTIS
ncbi:MAG: DNA-binding response regulator [Desulfotalea sp.]|nr:MAG: DNA-binding response regulator [Desulfotalea sp.]